MYLLFSLNIFANDIFAQHISEKVFLPLLKLPPLDVIRDAQFFRLKCG